MAKHLLCFLAAFTFFSLTSIGAMAEPLHSVPSFERKVTYPVDAIDIRYTSHHPHHPPLDCLYDLTLELPCEGGTVPEVITLRELADRFAPVHFSSEGIVALARGIVEHFAEWGLLGVFVSVDPADIDAYGNDIRQAHDLGLRLIVSIYRVVDIHTTASGSRFCRDHGSNRPEHNHIASCSPIQPAASGAGYTDILDREIIDYYLHLLSRHPGRQVDIELSPAELGEGVVLNYLVCEERPIKAYATVANSGTSSDYPYVERVGIYHTHLSGVDDILSLEYATTDFNDFNLFKGDYSRPLDCLGRWRVNVNGLWSEFSSSEFGLLEDEFTGGQTAAGVGLTFNFLQLCDFFGDVNAGISIRHIYVDNKISGISGESDFVLPSIGLSARLNRPYASFSASVSAEGNLGDLAQTHADDVSRLGRTTDDTNWLLLRGGVYASYFLDHSSRKEDECPGSTIHHELVGFANAQYAFRKRLAPQMEKPIGGVATVRAYPQSIVSGVNVVVGTLEYRYHRCLFNKDWHGIARLFCDAGNVHLNGKTSSERDSSLIGAGFGGEVVYRRMVQFRADLGFVLKQLSQEKISTGHSQLFVTATIAY